ncbi:MAG: hypothetical protein ACHQRM_10560 [Bacteroidia bacterium]
MISIFRIRVSSSIQIPVLFLLALVSFFILSPWKSPFLNSDNAVHILMTYDCQLPNDLYFWGQDRLGSFIPVFGHLLFSVLKLSPALAASIALYSVLFATVLLLSVFLDRAISRLLLAILIFFPLHQMDYLLRLGHPYASQFFFIALGLFCLKKSGYKKDMLSYLFLAGGTGSFMMALWSSDMTIVAFLALMICLCCMFILDKKSLLERIASFRISAGIVLLMALLGIGFVLYAKSVSRPVASYNTTWMGSKENILNGARKYFHVFTHILGGWQGMLSALHHWLMVVLSLLLARIFWLYIKTRNKQISVLALFFFLNFLGGECLMLLSKWVALNNFNGWYQTYPYISLMLCLLVMADKALTDRAGILLNTCLAVLLVSSAFSEIRIYRLKINRDFNERSLSELKDLQNLGHCGIIGDYWHSYLPAALNPELIKATPYEDGRSERCTDSVMTCEKIYLIKDAWLEKFPDEYNAYGRTLYFSKDSIKLSDWELGLYLRRKKE